MTHMTPNHPDTLGAGGRAEPEEADAHGLRGAVRLGGHIHHVGPSNCSGVHAQNCTFNCQAWTASAYSSAVQNSAVKIVYILTVIF